MQEVGNVALSCRACLQTSVAALQLQLEELRGQLQDTLGNFDKVGVRVCVGGGVE